MSSLQSLLDEQIKKDNLTVVDSSVINKQFNSYQDMTDSNNVVNFDTMSAQYDVLTKKINEAKLYSPQSIPQDDTKIELASKTEFPTPYFPKDIPTANRPTLPPYTLGETSVKSAVGHNNIINLEHTCDFTINLKAEACGTTFASIQKVFSLTIQKKIEIALSSKFPFLSYIKELFETLKAWYDYIMKYVNMIKKFIQCILDVMRAIANFINQLVSLPANLLNQVLGCIAGIQGMIIGAVFKARNVIIEELFGSSVSQINGVIGTIQNMNTNVSSYVDSVKSQATNIAQSVSYESLSQKISAVGTPAQKLASLNTYSDPIVKRFNITPMQALTMP